MNRFVSFRFTPCASLVGWALVLVCAGAFAQAPRGRGPQVVSPEVTEDGKVTFRILAPKAESVRLNAGDIPNLGQASELAKNDEGVWETTVGPINPPGAYRYLFNVDGVSVIDPTNPITSQSNANSWSLVYVPGLEFADTKPVPHGAVAEVTYYSKVLKNHRRMHIYTPPGYEKGDGKLPVFYLLHGASDCDDSWSTVGRAGFILDNLIAEGKAKPMIMVMPNGHIGRFTWGSSNVLAENFESEFIQDILPYVEDHYRVLTDRGSRAIAGLSMGGAQTLNIAVPNLEQFSYFGVFSSGVFGIAGGFGNQNQGPSWEEKNKAKLDDEALKKDLKLVWFATGKEDFLIETSRATVKMLESHKFNVEYKESEGGHTWINWRDYLAEFAPKLFR